MLLYFYADPLWPNECQERGNLESLLTVASFFYILDHAPTHTAVIADGTLHDIAILFHLSMNKSRASLSLSLYIYIYISLLE